MPSRGAGGTIPPTPTRAGKTSGTKRAGASAHWLQIRVRSRRLSGEVTRFLPPPLSGFSGWSVPAPSRRASRASRSFFTLQRSFLVLKV